MVVVYLIQVQCRVCATHFP